MSSTTPERFDVSVPDLLPLAQDPIVEWRRVDEQLNALSTLQDDYDGAGSVAPLSGAITTARLVMGALGDAGSMTPSALAPTPTGGIVLEWRVSASYYFEIEIPALFTAEFMLMRTGFPTVHWETPKR